MAFKGGVDLPFKLLSVKRASGSNNCLVVPLFLLKAASLWAAYTI